MPEPTAGKASLSRRLTMALMLVMTLIMMLTGGVFYRFSVVELEKDFTAKVNRTFDFLSGALAPLLWTLDQDTVVKIGQVALKNELISGVTIKDHKGRILFAVTAQEDNGQGPEARTINFDGKSVGELSVQFSRASLARNLRMILCLSVLFWMIAIISIAFFTRIFIRRYFRGPLAAFVDLARFYRNHPGTSPPKSTPFLEFNPIEEVVCSLANDVLDQLRKLKQHQHELEDRIAERTAQIRSLSSELLLTEERERHQIAVDLHDRIGQALAFSKMKLGRLKASEIPSALTAIVDDVQTTIDQTIEDTRTLIFELSPSILYELGFEAAVESFLENVRQEHGIWIEFADDGQSKPLDNSSCVLLFRATRELVYNILKHSQAQNAKISILRHEAMIKIIAEDDGVGLDPAEMARHAGTNQKFGLFSIQERLTHLGGQVEIESQIGQGSRFTLVAPLKPVG